MVVVVVVVVVTAARVEDDPVRIALLLVVMIVDDGVEDISGRVEDGKRLIGRSNDAALRCILMLVVLDLDLDAGEEWMGGGKRS